ncbi:rhomboid family intramembrane serine protease [Litoribacillus peritrichatus]|uniref:Rhomboid family intramembrane serine protease n=1 Tax=Litoribacillus peritrichatus TaxID=718191 RepID=A0ABP7M4U1_9GAMM
MFKLGEVQSPEAVAELSARLWKAKIPHQVVERPAEESTTGVLSEIWLVREQDLPLAVSLLNNASSDTSVSQEPSPIVASLSYARLTWVFIVACVIVSIVTGLGANIPVLSYFSIVPIEVRGDRLYAATLDYALSEGQIWRLFTPALLHLSFMHILFNMLWLWEFGRKIELLDGKSRLLTVIISSAVISNLAQYYVGSVLFGGMSGVIYALLGYMVVFDKLMPQARYQLPTGIVVFMLIWLVLGYTQFTEALGMGKIANAAHTAGLFSGVILAFLSAFIFRPARN